ncbi:MAG: nuclear transport factor 2 family protein [Propionivibrio sp.]
MDHHFDDPVQQEIWATLRALNDAWTQGDPTRLGDYFHRDMIAITPVDRLRREGAAACVAGWQGFAESTRVHRWQEIDPLVRVFGDAAVVSYYYEIRFEVGGETIEQDGRDLFFFVRENGRWWAVADQFSGYPA